MDAGEDVAGDDGPDGGPEDLDDVLRALADEHRRRAVRHLSRTDEPTGLDELVRTVTAEGDPGETARQRLHVQFHHHHLPLLEEAGIVEYDATAELVRLTCAVEPLESAIDAVKDASEG